MRIHLRDRQLEPCLGAQNLESASFTPLTIASSTDELVAVEGQALTISAAEGMRPALWRQQRLDLATENSLK